VEAERIVNAVGLVGLGGPRHSVATALAGHRVTLRLDGTVTTCSAATANYWPPSPRHLLGGCGLDPRCGGFEACRTLR